MLVCLAGILLSKSRGGGITILAILLCVPVWGFIQWPRSSRLKFRAAYAVGLTIFVTGFWFSGHGYIERFQAWFYIHDSQPDLESQGMLGQIKQFMAADNLLRHSRPRMIAGAWRAWKSEPVRGIGPGMHKVVWPHFAATADGDREAGTWPSHPFYDIYSAHVHSDWVQLLEEYGAIGFILFCLAAGAVYGLYYAARKLEKITWMEYDWEPIDTGHYGWVLGASLAFVALCVHSLGDFNLQIPAIGWMFAVVLAVPAALIVRSPA
jgi:O-antigen ligase